MGRETFSKDVYIRVRSKATQDGTRSATHAAEVSIRSGAGLDPLVDPKGLPHLGPVRMSLPRFDRVGNLWQLTKGLPMYVETVLDTTGSMSTNVDKAFDALPHDYAMLTDGNTPILGRYDTQIATAIFNDIEDGGQVAVLARSQFEMGEKIAEQMANLPPGRGGRGNGKEDSQFALFAGAYLTKGAINNWGLKGYHFTISDEPTVEYFDLSWLKAIFGDDVLERLKENGYDFVENLPTTAQAVEELQKRAHAFFLQVNDDEYVTRQWTDLYGREHVIALPEGTQYVHYVKSVIIGLTEGVLDLSSATEFMVSHGLGKQQAGQIIRAVSHIPLGAQMRAENFDRIPKAGDYFKEKTDLWPVNPDEVASLLAEVTSDEGVTEGPGWL